MKKKGLNTIQLKMVSFTSRSPTSLPGLKVLMSATSCLVRSAKTEILDSNGIEAKSVGVGLKVYNR